MEKDLLKYISVKISIVVDKKEKLFGSGSLFRYADKTYVVTAEHCIYGIKSERLADITKENILIQHRLNNEGISFCQNRNHWESVKDNSTTGNRWCADSDSHRSVHHKLELNALRASCL